VYISIDFVPSSGGVVICSFHFLDSLIHSIACTVHNRILVSGFLSVVVSLGLVESSRGFVGSLTQFLFTSFSSVFGEADNSHIELLEDTLWEFEQLSQEVEESRLREAWVRVASSERTIITMRAASVPDQGLASKKRSDWDYVPDDELEETYLERLAALKEIVPPEVRARVSEAAAVGWIVVKKSYTFISNSAWIVASGAAVMVLPYLVEKVISEEEYDAARYREILLGPYQTS